MRWWLALAIGFGCSRPASVCKLDTDEGVRAAYTRATGQKLAPANEGGCVARSATLHVAKIGTFANDRGCIYTGMLVGCEFGSSDAMRGKALAGAGWAEADAKRRGELARAWIEEVDEAPFIEREAFACTDNCPTFSAPSLATHPDGSLTWRYWTKWSGGMLPITHYARRESTFDASGARETDATLATFDMK